MEERPTEKNLEVGSFTVHTTRGLIRDRGTRRMIMAVMVVTSLGFMVLGSTLLESALDPRLHPTRFILFWVACAWVTVCALLLALFDLLITRREGRALRATLRRQLAAEANIASPNETRGE